VRQALAQLSTDHRAVLVLHEMCDLSVEQIAAQLRIPTGTVKTRLMRGRAALAALLTDPAEDDDAIPTRGQPQSAPPCRRRAGAAARRLTTCDRSAMGVPDVVGP
jgi:hypothetical protein